MNKAILRRMLDEQVKGNGYPERLVNLGSTGSWWQVFADAADQSPFRNRADYRSDLDRLRGYARFAADSIGISRQAVRAGVVQPCETLGGVERSIVGLDAADSEQSRYFAPFTRTKPADVAEADWRAIKAEAKKAIAEVVQPHNRAALAFFKSEYLPKCRKGPGVAALPRGADWYAWRVRVETTTDMTPEQVHRLGLSEVARIRAEMDAVDIDAEVNRYITMPGQALGYKVGELRLRALRQKSEKALGPRFDVRAFHDAVLAQGSVPLDVLDEQVDAYIASVKASGSWEEVWP